MKNWKKITLVYFAIGMIWGGASVYKQFDCQPNHVDASTLAGVFISNTILWPISFPMGIAVWDCQVPWK